MKNQLKISLLIISMLIAIAVSAQQPISVGVKGGLNVSNQKYKSGDLSYSPDSKIGFNVGLTLDLNLPSNLALMSGLELTTKGSKIKEEGEITMNAMYLQLPVHLGYKIEVAPGTKVHFDAGPYLAYGLGGKTKLKVESFEEEEDTFGKDAFKRFDFGLGIGAGITFMDKIQVRLGYDHGLVNVANSDNSEDIELKVNNKNFYVSLGYLFF